MAPERPMVISKLWFQAAIVTFALGFGVLVFLAWRIQTGKAPIPDRVTAPDGALVFSGEDIMTGQHVFQKYGLMQFGTLFGHGAYLGPDFMFVARHFIPDDRACQRAMAISFWGLNIGLLLMILINLVPLGGIQIYDAFANGYWHARDAAFFQRPIVRVFEWLRLPGDTIFIVAGILPVVYLALRMFAHRKRVAALGAGQPTEAFTRPTG